VCLSVSGNIRGTRLKATERYLPSDTGERASHKHQLAMPVLD